MVNWEMSMMQDPSTMVTASMMMIHDIIMEISTSVMACIFAVIISIILNKEKEKKKNESNKMEMIWTVVPILIIIYMAMPSLKLLYIMEEPTEPSMSVKIMGHQWYWSYEYPEFQKSFDSYMMDENTTKKFRLMDVDNRLVIPHKTQTRLLCSSMDVIHSWTVPSMGLKMDATPGRMSQMTTYPCLLGLYFGQCSEICGINHSQMPIVTEVVPTKMFSNWMEF